MKFGSSGIGVGRFMPPLEPLSLWAKRLFRITDDTFKRYRISIRMICGDHFSRQKFYEAGTAEEIDNEIVKLLTYVNPRSLKTARKMQSEKEDMFR